MLFIAKTGLFVSISFFSVLLNMAADDFWFFRLAGAIKKSIHRVCVLRFGCMCQSVHGNSKIMQQFM